MHSQLIKVSFAFLILIFVGPKNICALEWTSDDKLVSQFLQDIDFIGTEHAKYEAKGFDTSKVLPKFTWKRYDTVNGRFSPTYKTSTTRPSCSCTINHQAVDLGREYFPRYIQTGACRGDSCEKHHQCVEKTYKVKVLKRKEVKNVSLMSVPNNFQDFWSVEVIPIAVACECIADFQMIYQE